MLKTIRTMLMVAMLSGMATYAFAEDPAAPVYDADSLSQPSDAQPAQDKNEQNTDQNTTQSSDQANDQGDQNTQDEPPPSESKPSHVEVHEVPAATNPSAVQTDLVPTQSLTLDQRVRKVEQQINNLQTSGSSNKVEELQSEVQTLHGQVDDLTHQLQQLQQKQTEQQEAAASMEKRMSKLASAKPEETSSSSKSSEENNTTVHLPKPAQPDSESASLSDADKPVAKTGDTVQPDVAEEQQTYQTAYDLIKAKKYNDAIAALQGMLKKYPSGQSAANAHYWLGELYGLMGKNDQSASEFNTIIRSFPQSSKVSDAQLKIGLIYATEMKWSEAKSAFKRVINGYPGTASARLAQEQLKQIKQAGH